MIRLRRFEPQDRPVLKEICASTGLSGNLDDLFCDRELFAELWLAPYLYGEPENTIVIEEDERVVGYMVMSFSRNFKALLMRTVWRPVLKILWKNLTGQYRHHPPTQKFLRWLLYKSWRETPTPPAHCPHFHFNLDSAARGRDLGWVLLDKFEEICRKKGFKQWHSTIFLRPGKRSLRMYEKLGFSVVGKRPCSLFPEPAEIACIAKPL